MPDVRAAKFGLGKVGSDLPRPVVRRIGRLPDPPVVPNTPADQSAAGAKLSAAGREKLRRKLEEDYSSCVVSRDTLPALCYLQSIHQQAADKFFEWLPCRRILSEEQLLEVKARRSKATSDGPAPDEWDLELAGAALRVQQILETMDHGTRICDGLRLPPSLLGGIHEEIYGPLCAQAI